jgi:hypothetical protein
MGQGSAENLLSETAETLELQPIGLRANCIICSLFLGWTLIHKNRRKGREIAPGPGSAVTVWLAMPTYLCASV